MHKILVTWWAGYIWSHTVHYLISQWINPNQIVVFDNLIYGHKEYLPQWVIFIKGDLLNKKEIFECIEKHQIDSVIHFAAYAYVWESMENPWKYFENNIVWWLNLLEWMVKYWVKYIVFSSTCATYGIPEQMPISESTPQKPINPYWESKLMFEKILDWYDKIHWIRSVRLRYFNAAGAEFWIWEYHNPETHIIPLVIDAAIWKRDNIKIFWDDYDTPDWTNIRDYIHVKDLWDAHFKALKYLECWWKTDYFNLWTWIWTSVKKIVDLVRKISWKDFKVIVEWRRPWDPDSLVADNRKAIDVLWRKITKSMEETISDAYSWAKTLYNSL